MSIELYVKDRFSTMNLFLPFLCSAEDKNMILHYLTKQDFEEEEEKIEEEEEVEEEKELKPARLVQVNKEGDGLCVIDGVTGNVLETWEKEVTLNSIRLHFPDAIITENAQQFLNRGMEDKLNRGMEDKEDIDDEVEDELIDEEEHEPKDTSQIPITLEITAKITKRELTSENQHPISLDIDGKAYPYVSSGSFFGLCSSHDTVEEAVKSLHEWISQQKQWFKCYGRRIIVKLETVNEVTVKQQNLQAYF